MWEKGNSILCVLGNYLNKTHAACEWGYLRNDGLQIKLTSMPTLIKVVSSKLLNLLNIPTWGVGCILPM